ncbi:hypothetical protein ACU8OS_15755 [Rhizobium leguminosarum]
MGIEAVTTSLSDKLDAIFGPCLPAGQPVKPQEFQLRPASVQRLDVDTASILRQYLDTAKAGLLLSVAIHRVHPILWLVDHAGDVWFAVEEVVSEESGELLYTMARGSHIPPGHVKLGHPSLLISTTNKSARIGGEIKYFPASQVWKISNRSGRYGTRPHQTEAHLKAVAERFSEHGIELAINFWTP